MFNDKFHMNTTCSKFSYSRKLLNKLNIPLLLDVSPKLSILDITRALWLWGLVEEQTNSITNATICFEQCRMTLEKCRKQKIVLPNIEKFNIISDISVKEKLAELKCVEGIDLADNFITARKYSTGIKHLIKMLNNIPNELIASRVRDLLIKAVTNPQSKGDDLLTSSEICSIFEYILLDINKEKIVGSKKDDEVCKLNIIINYSSGTSVNCSVE